ncbi:hypothetical protein KKD62_00015 [Patescibacteria group bacterium]|nr:hypothetical protein [Patescibacteria group bacterium]
MLKSKRLLTSFCFSLIPILIFIFWVAQRVTPGIFLGFDYLPSDEEANYLTALTVFRGGGLYQDFAIAYPPCRFLLMGLLFKIFSPTIPVARLYFNLVTPVLFPALLFFLSYKVLQLLSKTESINQAILKNYFLSLILTLIYLLFVQSAQEVHVLTALFFLTGLLTWKNLKIKNFILGFILGLTYLFRLDSGLLISISLALTQLNQIKKNLKKIKFFISGLLTVWLPVMFLIILKGSLINFIHDVLILGLWTQPKMMSLPIPPSPLGLVFLASLIFLLGSSLLLIIKSRQNAFLFSLAIFSLLSFVSALGRSDESHLWYGLNWITIVLGVILFELFITKKDKNDFNWLSILKISLGLFVTAKLIIYFKSPLALILLISLGYLIIVSKVKNQRQQLSSKNIALATLLTSLLIFHSFSYLKLRLNLPGLPKSFNRPSTADKNKIAGLIFEPDYIETLTQIKINLSDDKNLFIFPDHVLFYEFFEKQNPTRHFYLTGERTEKTETEIIEQLAASQTQDFLIFPEKAEQRGGRVWQWIKQNTKITASYQLNNIKIELRKANQS